jgi:hypothetical protein
MSIMLKLEKRKDAIDQERLTDLKLLLSKTFDFYSKKLINTTFISQYKILRTLLHRLHKTIDFSHVLANNDTVIDINKNYHAIFHIGITRPLKFWVSHFWGIILAPRIPFLLGMMMGRMSVPPPPRPLLCGIMDNIHEILLMMLVPCLFSLLVQELDTFRHSA